MKKQSAVRGFAIVVPALLALANIGCGDKAQPAKEAFDGPFVAVSRDVDSSTTSALTSALSSSDKNAAAAAAALPKANQSFYLAISKEELGKKWFLSAFLSQV